MTGQRRQAAVHGVALARPLNVVAKVIALVRQILVTARLGLSARLDTVPGSCPRPGRGTGRSS